MTGWKVVKWLGYVATVAGGWVLVELLGLKPPSSTVQQVVLLAGSNTLAAIILDVGWLLLWGSLWLRADISQSLAEFSHRVPLFVRSKSLQPHHFDLAGYYEYYHRQPEYRKAQDMVQTQGRLLILGRPSGGKTRMAFEVAKALRSYWVLRLPVDFENWESLHVPHVGWLYRLHLLWFVDDLDKHVAKTDIACSERVLSQQCSLKLIATCRSGQELADVNKNQSMRSFVESLKSVTITCRDFTGAELLELARKTGRPAKASLYDKTPGSVTLGLKTMSERLQNAALLAQQIMRAMFLLRQTYIFEAESQLVQETVTQIYGQTPTALEFEFSVSWLVDNHFLRQSNPKLRPLHDVYLARDFLPYYGEQDSSFTTDLELLGPVVEAHGTGGELNSLGIYWGLRAEHARAAQYFQKAANTLRGDPIVMYNLGVALHQKGEWQPAIAAYREALALKPDFPEALNNLGNALGQLNRSAEEIAVYEEVVRRYGEATEAALQVQVARALFNKGNRLGQLNRSEEEIAVYDEVVRRFGEATEAELQVQVAWALVNKGVTLGQLNRSEEAIAVYDEVVRRFG
ncbi:MAG: tetratricopeptide repeat protein, partial [Acidobacteria bacterium]|nr:tetratricopeptide repeat protein [Acidobacteriota bacterium]